MAAIKGIDNREEGRLSPGGLIHTRTPLRPADLGEGRARENLDLVRALGHGKLRRYLGSNHQKKKSQRWSYRASEIPSLCFLGTTVGFSFSFSPQRVDPRTQAKGKREDTGSESLRDLPQVTLCQNKALNHSTNDPKSALWSPFAEPSYTSAFDSHCAAPPLWE